MRLQILSYFFLLQLLCLSCLTCVNILNTRPIYGKNSEVFWTNLGMYMMASDTGKDLGELNQHNVEDSFLDDGETSSRLLLPIKISEGLSGCGKPHLISPRNETCFSHLKRGPLFCSHLAKLQSCLVVSTEVRLTQECLKRYVAAVNFTKKLETYAENEISRLDGIHRHELSKNSRLAMEYYHKLCKEAGIHLDHWEHLVCKTKHHVKCFSQLLGVFRRIKKFHKRFLSLEGQILFLLSKIAFVGLRILANASFKQLSSTVDIQNFLQGIEEFNHMLQAYLQQSGHLSSVYGIRKLDRSSEGSNEYTHDSLNIVEILSTVCVERVKLLAKLSHEHFSYEVKAIELQDLLSTTRFSWTFDGHFSSRDLRQCTGDERYAKLQSVIKKYGHKEDEFINQLLSTASVCAFLHHESEIRRRSTEVCRQHLLKSMCECNLAQNKCLTCQQSNNSVKAITDGSEYDVDFYDLSEIPEPSDEPVNQDRRALFMESQQSKLKLQLCSIYRDDLWMMFAGEFQNSLCSLRWHYAKGTSLGPVCCWSTAVLMGITQHFGNLALTGPFPEAGSQSIQVVSCSLYLNSVLANYDALHCLMTAVGQVDKCKSATIIKGLPSTKTTSLMVQACSIFQHFFSTASHWDEFKRAESGLNDSTCNTLCVRIEDIFDRFGSFLSYCVYWFTTKVKHFLASWSLSPFLVLTQYELGTLMKSINTTLQQMENMHCQLGVDTSQGTMMKKYWEVMERKAAHLQVIEVESWENFKQQFITIASEFWQDMMPTGRLWKRSRNSGSACNEPSSYVEHVIVQILQPVIEGVSQLPLGLQNHILIQAVEVMMDTWSSHILKEEIKFSVIGAYQLQVDFNYVKIWLTSEASSLDTSVQSDLAILDVFRQLNEAVHLLMIQPKKKKKINENGLEPEMESNTSAISGSSVLSTGSSYDEDLDLLNNQFIPNKEQWLNLRLRKAKPRIPLGIPACLRSTETA